MQHGIITQSELISAEKYFTLVNLSTINKEFMFLPHILLIMCHNPCHTSYALNYHNGEFRLLIWNWWINLVENFIGCFATYNFDFKLLEKRSDRLQYYKWLISYHFCSMEWFSKNKAIFESYFIDFKIIWS